MSDKKFYNLPHLPALAFSNQSASLSLYPICDQNPNEALYSPTYLLTISARSHQNDQSFVLNLSTTEMVRMARVLARYLANKAAQNTPSSAVVLASRNQRSLAFKVADFHGETKPTIYFNGANGQSFYLPLSPDDIALMRLKVIESLALSFPGTSIESLTTTLSI